MKEEANSKADITDPLVARIYGHDIRIHLSTTEAAAYLGLSPRTLEKHRCYGTGPIYRKLGGRVVYNVGQLDAWAEIGTRRSTSDPGKGTIFPAKRRFAPDVIGQ